VFADLLGITDSRYQYVLTAKARHDRMVREEDDEREKVEHARSSTSTTMSAATQSIHATQNIHQISDETSSISASEPSSSAEIPSLV